MFDTHLLERPIGGKGVIYYEPDEPRIARCLEEVDENLIVSENPTCEPCLLDAPTEADIDTYVGKVGTALDLVADGYIVVGMPDHLVDLVHDVSEALTRLHNKVSNLHAVNGAKRTHREKPVDILDAIRKNIEKAGFGDCIVEVPDGHYPILVKHADDTTEVKFGVS